MDGKGVPSLALEELGLGHRERGRDEGRAVLGGLGFRDGLRVEDDDRDVLGLGILVDALDLEDDAERDAGDEAPIAGEKRVARARGSTDAERPDGTVASARPMR